MDGWPDAIEVLLPAMTEPIPALLLADPDRTARSLVIFYSGLNGAKEVGDPRGDGRISADFVRALLGAGHDVLLPDYPAHGARRSGNRLPQDVLSESIAGAGRDLLALARDEATDLIDGALGLGVVTTPDRIALVGQSWGGMQVLQKISVEDRVACAVAIIPVCDVAELQQFTHLRHAARVRAARLEPPVGLPPLLLIAGAQDQIASAAHVRAFAERIRFAYDRAGHMERLRLVELDGVGHDFDPREADLMLDWLAQHLPV